MWTVALLSIGLTLLAVFLFANLVPGERRIEHQVQRLFDVSEAQFRRELSVLLGPNVLEGNAVQALINGARIFAPMLDAIRQARRSICFETYIYWSGEIGRAFADALCERARAGVATHVLLDWTGSLKIDQRMLGAMADAGVQVERFHKPAWSHLRRLNNRTHRKLLVVDGRLAFTGGVGVADPWQGDAQDPQHWRDTHFRIAGPVVAQMQAVFMDNWIKATGRVLHGEDYFPPLAPAGTLQAQMFSSSPSGGSESMHLMYLLTIVSARRSVLLQSAYFVPDRLAVRALAEAARRGVHVRILVPGRHNDSKVVRRASRALWGTLLDAGVRIAEYQPTMLHCKVLVVDEVMVSVGSTNFDNRSFKLNDEANLNVLDTGFAREQAAVFEADWAQARPVTLESWQRRPWPERAVERMALVLRPQL